MAEQKLASDPGGAQELLAEARRGTREALEELRDLARGIHPPVLADRGLEAAIAALADRTPLHVDVVVDVRRRPPRAVESAAYFVVAEALANTGKHAHAEHVDIDVRDDAGDSSSSRSSTTAPAAPNPGGSGLRGLARRVEALDGDARGLSPAGGPTTVQGGDAVRVVIAEDLALLRDGLTRLLRDNGFDVVARRRRTATRSSRAVLLERPDVAIVDIRLPPTFRDEGLRAALTLRERAPETGGADRVAVRRAGVRRGAARRRPRRARLSAEGPDHGRRRLRRRRAPRRGRRHRARPRGRRAALRGAEPDGPLDVALAARDRGARADGRGALERRDRRASSC